MSATIIDGNALAQEVRAEWKVRAERLEKAGVQPGLAVIIVGNNPASSIYVRNKAKASREIGIYSEIHEFGEDASQEEVIQRIRELNSNPAIHGILVQLPLPRHFESAKVIESIAIEKDADGFHLYNVGALVAGNTVFPPCTPYGVMKMLEKYRIKVEGQHAVVVGRSNIVGKPMALMLMQRDATVCICHANTRDLAQFTILADILVVAAGKPRLILPQMVRTGAVVVDVGINRLPSGRLVGDTDFDGLMEKASYITPVPGGVGPMTVTMLLANTLASAKRIAQRGT